jgi:hypothetical protein
MNNSIQRRDNTDLDPSAEGGRADHARSDRAAPVRSELQIVSDWLQTALGRGAQAEREADARNLRSGSAREDLAREGLSRESTLVTEVRSSRDGRRGRRRRRGAAAVAATWPTFGPSVSGPASETLTSGRARAPQPDAERSNPAAGPRVSLLAARGTVTPTTATPTMVTPASRLPNLPRPIDPMSDQEAALSDIDESEPLDPGVEEGDSQVRAGRAQRPAGLDLRAIGADAVTSTRGESARHADARPTRRPSGLGFFGVAEPSQAVDRSRSTLTAAGSGAAGRESATDSGDANASAVARAAIASSSVTGGVMGSGASDESSTSTTWRPQARQAQPFEPNPHRDERPGLGLSLRHVLHDELALSIRAGSAVEDERRGRSALHAAASALPTQEASDTQRHRVNADGEAAERPASGHHTQRAGDIRSAPPTTSAQGELREAQLRDGGAAGLRAQDPRPSTHPPVAVDAGIFAPTQARGGAPTDAAGLASTVTSAVPKVGASASLLLELVEGFRPDARQLGREPDATLMPLLQAMSDEGVSVWSSLAMRANGEDRDGHADQDAVMRSNARAAAGAQGERLAVREAATTGHDGDAERTSRRASQAALRGADAARVTTPLSESEPTGDDEPSGAAPADDGVDRSLREDVDRAMGPGSSGGPVAPPVVGTQTSIGRADSAADPVDIDASRGEGDDTTSIYDMNAPQFFDTLRTFEGRSRVTAALLSHLREGGALDAWPQRFADGKLRRILELEPALVRLLLR